MSPTTLTLSSTAILVDIHRIARRHGFKVVIDDLADKPGPYRWRLAVRQTYDGATVVGVAVKTAEEVEEAVRFVWSAFVRWGVM